MLDTLSLGVKKTDDESGAPLGSALLAGCRVGLFTDLSHTAGEWIREKDRIQPDVKMANHYHRRTDMYVDIIDERNEVYKKYS